MSRKKNTDISALVLKAQEGDTDAFAKLYDELVTPLYRYVYYRVEPDIAEDITEEAFLKAWQNLKKYKPGEHPFSAWLFRIAHNLVVDHYRKKQDFTEIDENLPAKESDIDPKRNTSLKIDKIQLHKIIRKLPDNYQQVIVLKYINDLSNPEISSVMGKSEGAIRTLQSRALKELRDMIEKNDLHF